MRGQGCRERLRSRENDESNSAGKEGDKEATTRERNRERESKNMRERERGNRSSNDGETGNAIRVLAAFAAERMPTCDGERAPTRYWTQYTKPDARTEAALLVSPLQHEHNLAVRQRHQQGRQVRVAWWCDALAAQWIA